LPRHTHLLKPAAEHALAASQGAIRAIRLCGHPAIRLCGHPVYLTVGHPGYLTVGHPAYLTVGHPAYLTVRPSGLSGCAAIRAVRLWA
jgi:hypothetical protein